MKSLVLALSVLVFVVGCGKDGASNLLAEVERAEQSLAEEGCEYSRSSVDRNSIKITLECSDVESKEQLVARIQALEVYAQAGGAAAANTDIDQNTREELSVKANLAAQMQENMALVLLFFFEGP